MNRIAVLIPQELLAQDREWAHDESIEQISEHVYRFGNVRLSVSLSRTQYQYQTRRRCALY
jgi:hypothetical protein